MTNEITNIKYSPSTGGFYSPDFHKVIPNDAVDVAYSDYEKLFQSDGEIVPDQNGYPVKKEPPAPPSQDSVVRRQRNELLAASDWTQVADAPVDQAAWAIYRQALRDIPAQEGFPETVEWPVMPN